MKYSLYLKAAVKRYVAVLKVPRSPARFSHSEINPKLEFFFLSMAHALLRRLLDALWMSAKRGSSTLPLSVADGRVILTGLMASGGGGAGIDLGMPLPQATVAAAISAEKPLRPVVGGASGPFARAAINRKEEGDGRSGDRRSRG